MALLDRPVKRALYLQLRDLLAERIAQGTWKAGAHIPNEMDLAREVGVSSGTVRKALEVMEAQRLITRRQGRGTYVNDPNAAGLADRFSNIRGAGGERISGRVNLREIIEGIATSLERERLRLPGDAAVFRIHRVREHAGRNFLVEHITVPAVLFAGLLDGRAVIDDIVSLAQHHGILLGRGEERLTTTVPSVAIAQALGITAGMPVVMLDRVLFMLQTDCPVEWRIGYFHLPDGYYASEAVICISPLGH
jgi:GntR family transcriptional regulator